jgi:hypothetical protein
VSHFESNYFSDSFAKMLLMRDQDKKVIIQMICSPKQRKVISAFCKKYNLQHGTHYTRSELMLLAFSEFAKRSKINIELVQPELFEEA